nr:hypothetical protein KitaXyl93_56980 [Kitasatospora sp. Xyl93]
MGIALALGFVLFAPAYALGPVSGCHLNPARSPGPALFAGGDALSQLWLFLLAPPAGGALAAGVHLLTHPQPTFRWRRP